MIVMFLAAEMMLQGVSVSLVAWGRYHNDWGGQVLVIFIIAIAACEAAIALVLVLMLFQRTGRLDVAAWQELREANQPAYVDEECRERSPIRRRNGRIAPRRRRPASDSRSRRNTVSMFDIPHPADPDSRPAAGGRAC